MYAAADAKLCSTFCFDSLNLQSVLRKLQLNFGKRNNILVGLKSCRMRLTFICQNCLVSVCDVPCVAAPLNPNTHSTIHVNTMMTIQTIRARQKIIYDKDKHLFVFISCRMKLPARIWHLGTYYLFDCAIRMLTSTHCVHEVNTNDMIDQTKTTLNVLYFGVKCISPGAFDKCRIS